MPFCMFVIAAGPSKHHPALKEMEGSKHISGGIYGNSNHPHHHHQHHHHHHHHSGVAVNQIHLPVSVTSSSPQDLTRTSSDSSSTKKPASATAATAAAAVYRAVSHLQPSVYEMAALTQDLDTQLITTKIKETLLANNIGQKVSWESLSSRCQLFCSGRNDDKLWVLPVVSFVDLWGSGFRAVTRLSQRAAFKTKTMAHVEHQRSGTFHSNATVA